MSLEDDPSACQLTVFRQSNCFFQTRQNAIIGCRYLGKYVSVFDAVKSIFFSETSSTRIMGAEIPANYPFKQQIQPGLKKAVLIKKSVYSKVGQVKWLKTYGLVL